MKVIDGGVTAAKGFQAAAAAAGIKYKDRTDTVSYTHLRAHETGRNLVCRLLLEKKKKKNI